MSGASKLGTFVRCWTGRDLPSSLPETIKNEVSSMVDIISFDVPDTQPPPCPDLVVSDKTQILERSAPDNLERNKRSLALSPIVRQDQRSRAFGFLLSRRRIRRGSSSSSSLRLAIARDLVVSDKTQILERSAPDNLERNKRSLALSPIVTTFV
jgi:hypothetical protein